MFRAPVALTLLLAASCVATSDDDRSGRGPGGATETAGAPTSPIGTDGLVAVDADGDGWPASEDCDDDHELVHPGAVEICDDLDNDCNDLVDDDDPALDLGSATVWFEDHDGDGHGLDGSAVHQCDPPRTDFALEGGDCDDADEARSPSADEVCNDIDDDCDGAIDDDDDDVDTTTGRAFFADDDGDGLGEPTARVFACEQAPGLSLDDSDCDDADPYVLGPKSWGVDEDGDGYTAESLLVACVAPGPGWTTGLLEGDCDDHDSARSPSLPEICGDGVDNDCDASAPDVITIGWLPGFGDWHDHPDLAFEELMATNHRRECAVRVEDVPLMFDAATLDDRGYLLAQALDRIVDCARTQPRCVSPHLFQQAFATDDLPGMLGQEPRQRELGLGER